ncbi:hypothetical protein AB6E89_01375 [Vibrio breoganii]
MPSDNNENLPAFKEYLLLKLLQTSCIFALLVVVVFCSYYFEIQLLIDVWSKSLLLMLATIMTGMVMKEPGVGEVPVTYLFGLSLFLATPFFAVAWGLYRNFVLPTDGDMEVTMGSLSLGVFVCLMIVIFGRKLGGELCRSNA